MIDSSGRRRAARRRGRRRRRRRRGAARRALGGAAVGHAFLVAPARATGGGSLERAGAGTPRGRRRAGAARRQTADTYWRGKLKGEAPTAEETEFFDRLVAAFKAMNPCHRPSKALSGQYSQLRISSQRRLHVTLISAARSHSDGLAPRPRPGAPAVASAAASPKASLTRPSKLSPRLPPPSRYRFAGRWGSLVVLAIVVAGVRGGAVAGVPLLQQLDEAAGGDGSSASAPSVAARWRRRWRRQRSPLARCAASTGRTTPCTGSAC